eukprot:10707129-Alexandrium_andersonii.AAC.1
MFEDGSIRVLDGDWRDQGKSAPIESAWTGATAFYEGAVSVPLPQGEPASSSGAGVDVEGQGLGGPAPIDASEP